MMFDCLGWGQGGYSADCGAAFVKTALVQELVMLFPACLGQFGPSGVKVGGFL